MACGALLLSSSTVFSKGVTEGPTACETAAASAAESGSRGGRLRVARQIKIIRDANKKCYRVHTKLLSAQGSAAQPPKTVHSCSAVLASIKSANQSRAKTVILGQLTKIKRALSQCLVIKKRLISRK
jgi:hypothetical protein